MRDKMRTFIESKVVAACELNEIASHDVQVKTIFNLMQGDVKSCFTAQQFKKVLDPQHPEGYLGDVALRLVSQFYNQKQRGINPPIPNLGNYTLEQRHTNEGDKMF
jgi:hypothetical protein